MPGRAASGRRRRRSRSSRVEPDAPRVVTPDQAIVQFTSGTTGAPKAVVLRHDTVGELLDTVIGSLRGGRQGERAPMPNLVPMSLSLWAGIYQVLFAFKLGAPVVLMEQFEPREFARLVREYGIRSSVLPPAALVMLTDDTAVDDPSNRCATCAACPRRCRPRTPAASTNASASRSSTATARPSSAARRSVGARPTGRSSGRRSSARSAVRTRRSSSVCAATTVRSARRDEVGELEIRSSSALPPDDAAMEGRVTPDGWLRTGDLARIDADGFVWIEGRVSAMINRGGLKVFPDEVEECIRAHRRRRRRRRRRCSATTASARCRGPSSSAPSTSHTLQERCRADARAVQGPRRRHARRRAPAQRDRQGAPPGPRPARAGPLTILTRRTTLAGRRSITGAGRVRECQRAAEPSYG